MGSIIAGTNCSAISALWSSDFSTNVSISRSATWCTERSSGLRDGKRAAACVRKAGVKAVICLSDGSASLDMLIC